LGSESLVKQKANSIHAFTTERTTFIRERPALYTEIHVKVLDLFKENEDNYRNSKVYDEKIEVSLALASTYVDDMLESKNEGNYKIAIDKGNTYHSILSSLKTDINAFVVRRREVDYEANKALETYEKSLPILKNTKYDSNITSIKNEIERVKGIRIVSNQLNYYKGRMIEFDEQIKEMVSDCVLNGCERIIEEEVINGEELNETINDIPTDLNDTEIPPFFEEKPSEPSIIDSVIKTISSIIHNVLSTFSRLLGN